MSVPANCPRCGLAKQFETSICVCGWHFYLNEMVGAKPTTAAARGAAVPAPPATPPALAPTASPVAPPAGAAWLAPRWPFALATAVGMVVGSATLTFGGDLGDSVCVVGALALHNFVWAIFASWVGSRRGRRLEAELLAFALGPIGLGLAFTLQPSAEYVWKKAALEAAKRGEVAPSRGDDPPPGMAGWWLLGIGAVLAVLIVGCGGGEPRPTPTSIMQDQDEQFKRGEKVIEEIRAERLADEAEVKPVPTRPACLPQYAGACVPAPPPDLDCKDIGHPIAVLGEDVHRLDRDGDGRACEGGRG